MDKTVYTIENGCITRTTYTRKRKQVTSNIVIPKNIVNRLPSADLYEEAWLKSKEKPAGEATHGIIRAVDLFCGCGGLTLGIQEACRALGFGFSSVYASDIDSHALELYRRNFTPIVADKLPIEQVIDAPLGAPLSEAEDRFVRSVGAIDILLAGPPCQGNSDLNNHTRRDDERNLLYLRAIRCAEILRPQSIIIENVPGVLHDKHSVLQTAISHLEAIGYHVDYGVVSMDKIGVPQRRRRMVLLASTSFIPNLDEILNEASCAERPLSWACNDLLGKTNNATVFDSSANHSATNKARIDYLFDNDLHDLPNSQRPDCHRLKPHSYTSVYGRMYWDRPTPTITGGFGSTGQGRFVHPLERRTLTPHEAARVQFFPDFFDFSGVGRRELQQFIGNAVPSKAGYIIALNLLQNREIEIEGH